LQRYELRRAQLLDPLAAALAMRCTRDAVRACVAREARRRAEPAQYARRVRPPLTRLARVQRLALGRGKARERAARAVRECDGALGRTLPRGTGIGKE
jgi:hypothetical protein